MLMRAPESRCVCGRLGASATSENRGLWNNERPDFAARFDHFLKSCVKSEHSDPEAWKVMEYECEFDLSQETFDAFDLLP